MQSRYAKEVKQIMKALDEPEENQSLPDEEAPHAYPVNIGGVEGILFTKEEVSPEFFTDSAVVDEEEPDHTPKQVREGPPYFLYFVFLLLLFLVFDSLDSMLINLFTPTATITIIASEHDFTTSAAMTIPTHTFKQVSFSDTETIPTTGKGHKAATFAYGEVTFYNTAFYAQSIPQGTLITTSSGVNIVTLHDVYLAAGNGVTNGVASVEAQADVAGVLGNINADTIDGPCCKEGIIARNTSAFSGGADARDYQFVTPSDIQGAESSLLVKINGEKQEAQGRIPNSDTLLTPVPCSKKLQATHRVGDEASSVTVTINQNCSIVSYSQKAFNDELLNEVLRTVKARFGNTYTLLQSPTATIAEAKVEQGQIAFTASSTVLYGLDLGRSRTGTLSAKIAGLSRQQALQILRSETGVNSISLVLTSSNKSLPTDITL